MKKLTDRQSAILGFIAKFIEGHGYAPTHREIGAAFSITAMAAHDHVVKIAAKGYLKMCGRRPRSMELVKLDGGNGHESFLDVPIVGDVAAGAPILSEENYEGSLRVDSSMLKRGAVYFAMRVRGDSMTGAGILSGDTVLIEKRENAENGQIVVAVTNEAVTLKRFFREHSRIRLQSENPAYKPIFTTDLRIAGVLVMSIRRY
jgi:repressor LexA